MARKAAAKLLAALGQSRLPTRQHSGPAQQQANEGLQQ
jgi:hypothetical protein